MKRLMFDLVGETPLIMHADTLVDGFHSLAIEKRLLTDKKKNKTEEDIKRVEEIEFITGLYLHNDLGPVIPGANIDKMIIEAARRSRAGKKAEMGMQAADDYFPLQYSGPRDLKGLLAEKRFQFRRSIKQNKVRIMRVRPWFHDWTVKIAIDYDEAILNSADIVSFIGIAGKYIGIGDWRPRYGRFSVRSTS